MRKLKIDKEFQSLIYPCSDMEYENLELGIFDNGCQVPIDIWNNTIIDGHKRYKICMEYEIPFTVNTLSLKYREEAICIIISKQLKRSDITTEMHKYLIGKYFEAKKQIYIHTVDFKDAKNRKRGILYHIAGIVGKELNLAAGTVYKYSYFTRAIDSIISKEKSLSEKILSGKLKVSHENVIELSRLSSEELRTLYSGIAKTDYARIGYSEIRHELHWQRLPSTPKRSQKKAEVQLPIKEIPKYDPDVEITSLALTVPSWISTIERTKNTADFPKTTKTARTKLIESLFRLQLKISDITAILTEVQKNG